MRKLKDTIFSNDSTYGTLVSVDCKAALIVADFFEEDIDYSELFEELQRIRKATEDENTIVSITGHPMHLGYVRSHVRDVLFILGVTVIAMLFLFYFYFRSKRGMILPMISAAISAIWGLAIIKLLGFHLDPLILVLPFLISTRSAGHTTQIVKRLYHI